MTAPNPPTGPSRARLWLVCLALFCGTLLLFGHALHNGFIDLDDPDYVTLNPHVQGGFTWANVRWAFTSGDASNWHPLTWLSHMADFRLYGKNPLGHHATGILLHAINAVLVLLLLRRLTGAFWTSALCAALFAGHPLRVESVAWVAERKDVLSAFFFLLTLLLYAKYVSGASGQAAGAGEAGNIQHSTFNIQHPSGKKADHASRFAVHASSWYLLCVFCFAFGLLCKPMLVTLPFLLLLLDWWPLGRFAICGLRFARRRLIWEKIPFFLLSAASCVITYIVQKEAGAVVDTISLADRLANAAVSVVRYLGKFFWPFDLAIGYPSPAHWPAMSVAGATLLLLAITAVVWGQRRQRPWILTGWLWFLGMLVPVIGIVQVGLQAMADRYTYLPILGLQLALLWTLREIRWPAAWRWLAPAAASLVLVACALRTWSQLGYWRDPSTLYGHALAVTRENYLAESYLGTTLLNEERFAEAGVHFRRAIELKPNYVEAHYRLASSLDKLDQPGQAIRMYEAVLKLNPAYGMAHYSLGALLLGRHQPSNAIPHFEAALMRKPDYDPAYVGLGSAMSELGRPQEAIPFFEKALAINPQNPVAQFNYANALADLERYEEACRRYEQALALDADFEEAHCNYGNSLRAVNRLEDACAQYRRALSLQPKDASAYYGLGAALEDLGRTDEAIAGYQAAVRLNPDYPEAQYNLAVTLLNRNQAAEAMPHFQAAVHSQPDHVQAWFGLGLAAAQLGKFQEAIGYYERALAIAPDNAGALCCLGVSLRRQNKFAEAIPYYEHALRAKPDYAEAHAELGNALYRTGRAAEAIPHLEAALKLHPDFPGTTELLSKARGEQEKSSGNR